MEPRIGEEENGGMSATSNAIGTSEVEISKPASCNYVSNLFVLPSIVYDDNSFSNKRK